MMKEKLIRISSKYNDLALEISNSKRFQNESKDWYIYTQTTDLAAARLHNYGLEAIPGYKLTEEAKEIFKNELQNRN